MVYSIGIKYYRLFFIFFAIYLMILMIQHMDNGLNHYISDKIKNEIEEIKVSREDKLRTILLWTPFYNDDAYMFGFDEEPFVGENRCPVGNCLVTKNQTMLDIEDYDVIVFHLWGTSLPANFAPPKRRSPKQYYAFASLEVSDYRQVTKVPKDFFNWTITYRQDSDFHWPYYKITDLYNISRIVAPATSPEWIEHRDKIVDVSKAVPTLDKKHRKAAWFASQCTSNNGREKYVAKLQKHIEIDVYGRCGTFKCKRKDQDDPCHEMLQTDYYFYLAFENSDCFDYITEKATHPLQHDVIPIVFGAANYTQHLPPHSYINAKEYKPKELAELMDRIIANQTEYAHYFWWKDHYKIHNIGIATVRALPYLHPFCEICKTLQSLSPPEKRYDDINAWWVGNETHPACTD